MDNFFLLVANRQSVHRSLNFMKQCGFTPIMEDEEYAIEFDQYNNNHDCRDCVGLTALNLPNGTVAIVISVKSSAIGYGMRMYEFDPTIDISSPEMKLAIALGYMPYKLLD